MTTAYQGHEPYIFISYSHSDSDAALKIIKALSEAGFRVWYDNGIDVFECPGENMTVDI